MRFVSHGRIVLGLVVGTLMGCRSTTDYNSGEIEFTPERPEVEDSTPTSPYEGTNPIVIEAQQRFPTGLELHRKVIWRTCTPNGGVCHNSKEYPDLRTPAGFAAAFDAPCNVQPGETSSVFDGCERAADRLHLDAFEDEPVAIAWIEQVVTLTADDENAQAPGLHIHLVTPLPGDRTEGWSTARFSRTFTDEAGDVRDLDYATFDTEWHVLEGRTHLIGNIEEYQTDAVQALLDIDMIEGDANRNGTIGSTLDMDVRLLVPGSPEQSYLIGRIRGEMFDAPLPGSRMPLANSPLSIPEMLALFCLIEGFPAEADQEYLSSSIDYRNCSYSENPEDLNLLGNGVTWASRVRPILETNCGGCHSEQEAQGDLVLVGDGVYERLLAPSAQVPDLPLITPATPDASYLYLKLIGDDAIVGSPMPLNPLTGTGRLSEAELGDILTWITNGAIEDQ